MKKDLATKNLIRCPDVFADIINVNMYDGKEVVSPKDLELLPSEMIFRDIDGALGQRNQDVRMLVRQAGMEMAVVCTENQSGICNTMPVRDMGYIYCNYNEQIRRIKCENRERNRNFYAKEIGDKQKLVPVISFILYYGEEEWKSPLSLMDMLDIPEDKKDLIRPFIQNHHIHIIVLSGQDGETRKKYKSDFRNIVDYLACKKNSRKLEAYMRDASRKIEHPEEFLDLMGSISNDARYRKIVESIRKHKEKGEVSMCIIAEELENRGMEKGMEKGMGRINLLNARLIDDKRTEELIRSAKDVVLQRKLMKEYGI